VTGLPRLTQIWRNCCRQVAIALGNGPPAQHDAFVLAALDVPKTENMPPESVRGVVLTTDSEELVVEDCHSDPDWDLTRQQGSDSFRGHPNSAADRTDSDSQGE
jgi:hypothetical protein